VRSIVDECYATAEKILQENRDKLDLMSEALMLYETLDVSQIDAVMAGRMPDPPGDWSDGAGGSETGSEDSEVTGKQADEDGHDASGPIGGPAQEH
jgi:cell division protease FtsH